MYTATQKHTILKTKCICKGIKPITVLTQNLDFLKKLRKLHFTILIIYE